MSDYALRYERPRVLNPAGPTPGRDHLSRQELQSRIQSSRIHTPHDTISSQAARTGTSSSKNLSMADLHRAFKHMKTDNQQDYAMSCLKFKTTCVTQGFTPNENLEKVIQDPLVDFKKVVKCMQDFERPPSRDRKWLASGYQDSKIVPLNDAKLAASMSSLQNSSSRDVQSRLSGSKKHFEAAASNRTGSRVNLPPYAGKLNDVTSSSQYRCRC